MNDSVALISRQSCKHSFLLHILFLCPVKDNFHHMCVRLDVERMMMWWDPTQCVGISHSRKRFVRSHLRVATKSISESKNGKPSEAKYSNRTKIRKILFFSVTEEKPRTWDKKKAKGETWRLGKNRSCLALVWSGDGIFRFVSSPIEIIVIHPNDSRG